MNGRSFFAVGLILVLLGVQLRAVETFVLNDKATQFVEKRMKSNAIVSDGSYNASFYTMTGPAAGKQLTHPRWAGLALIAVGAVLLLHGLSHKGE